MLDFKVLLSFLILLTLLGIVALFVTGCTNKYKLDGFDPTTSVIKWVITSEKPEK
jgi:hypothetical protein|tara:strand:+ start:251 stop:415 length:165 start_codon:yes stop_codon:yes gene_type:complete